jgi:hypothetical protein
MVRVNMHRYGWSGWEWSEATESGIRFYRTDGQGKGLWIRQQTCSLMTGDDVDGFNPASDRRWEWSQLNAEFDLQLPYSRAAAYKWIRETARFRDVVVYL